MDIQPGDGSGDADGSHGFQDGGGLTPGIGPILGIGIDRLTLATVGGATGILSQPSIRGSGINREVNNYGIFKRI